MVSTSALWPVDMTTVANPNKVIAGRVGAVSGPIAQPATDPTYLDLALKTGAKFAEALPQDYAAFLYVFEGSVKVGAGAAAQTVGSHELAVLGSGSQVLIEGVAPGADGESARAILVAGRPLRESVAKYGPFVMNTNEELHQAFMDYQTGKF